MPVIHRKLKLAPPIGFCLLLTLTLISCLPNIRIQVNNDNHQSPPYLLEVIKQAELLAKQPIPSSVAPTTQSVRHSVLSEANNVATGPPKSAQASPIESISEISTQDNKAVGKVTNKDENDAHISRGASNEETLESLDILGLDSDAVLKLLPDSLTGSVSDLTHVDHVPSIAAVDVASSGQPESVNNPIESNNKKHLEMIPSTDQVVTDKHDIQPIAVQHQPQMPVTNAHLKKPAGHSSEDVKVNPVSTDSTKPSQSSLVDSKIPVSPSITMDVSSAPTPLDLNIKRAPIPPDTWAPEQIVDSANISSIPPLVKKQYGANASRTRITLGGGYIRDRQPPLVDPASSSYVDRKPEKPIAPLERTSPPVKPDNPVADVSRVIQVPEKILVQDSSIVSPISRRPAATKVTLAINGTKEQENWPGTPDSRCPKEGISTFEHSTSCDKYFYCEDGYISEETCPNGLMYGTRDTIKDYCVHRWKADCGDRSIPKPISSPGCRWQYGLFSVQGSPKCSQDYYECVEGKFQVKKCPIEGQVYVDATKSCQYPERVGCTDEVLVDFKCPVDDQSNTYWPFPRYFLNDRALIHCVNDKPQIVRCTDGERVDPEHLHCVPLVKSTQSVTVNSPERRSRVKKKTTI